MAQTKLKYSSLFISAFASLLIQVYSYNILALFPYPIKSHYIVFDSILTELAHRGHHVTVINTFPKSKALPNFTDIDVSSCFSLKLNLLAMDVAYNSHSPRAQIDLMLSRVKLYENSFTCAPMMDFYKYGKRTSFDLVITEIFIADVMFAFANQFEAPIMSFCAGMVYPWATQRMGNPFNPSYMSYPHTDMPLNKDMSFHRRFYNTIIYLYASWMYYYKSHKVGDAMIRKHLDSDMPSLDQLSRNTSLILSFSHFSLNEPIPLVPNIVQIAGVHIKKPKPLPEDIEKFIRESKHGVIYFCLGSLLRIETLPAEKLNAFLYAFSKLPQRVLWKWNSDQLPGKTDNIFISKWMPQRDILAHPNVKLFIAHGGALGVNEAIYEGVPILGIPIFADQTLLLETIEWHGAAETINYLQINNQTVLTKLQLLLNDKKYTENMKKLSVIYKDRPMSPLDTAIFWIEYIIRHKGAPHLRSSAIDLPLYQYFLLDVIAFILFVLILILLAIYYAFKTIIRLMCNLNSDKNRSTKKIKKK